MMDIPNKTRWKKCTLDELIGADYALRIFLTSPLLRGETRKQCEELINEVRVVVPVSHVCGESEETCDSAPASAVAAAGAEEFCVFIAFAKASPNFCAKLPIAFPPR